MGVFCKKVNLSSTQGALCTVSVFFILHFTYLGSAYAPNASPPLPTGLGRRRLCLSVASRYSIETVGLIELVFGTVTYRVAQNKIPHRRICNISATNGLILKILEAA